MHNTSRRGATAGDLADAQVTKASAIPTLADGLVQLCRVIGTQSSEHIKPINAYCAARLVMEGGILPEWVRPRPPLVSRPINNAVHELEYSGAAEDRGERRVLGGIKYKNVDVTAVVNGLGPALGCLQKVPGTPLE